MLSRHVRTFKTVPVVYRLSFGSTRMLSSGEKMSKSLDKVAEEGTGKMELQDSLYTAKFGPRIRFLRRFSFASSLASTALLATVASGFSPSSMAIFGQYMIAGTGFLASVGGTAFVHMVTSPYVTSLRPYVLPGSSTPPKDRSFEVTTLNLFGSDVKKTFSMSQVGESIHPFASFKAVDSHFYIFGGGLHDQEDNELKDTLTKRGDNM
jgi:hypothetical protein